MSAATIRRRAIGAGIRIYRKVPGHQTLRKPLMRLLSREGERIADIGPFRMHVDLGEMIESRIYYTGTWEPETVSTLQRLVKPGDTVIDVGAHVGFITLHLACLVGPAGRVHAFEASDWAHQRLQSNLLLNQFDQVSAYNLGVSDRTGSETLMLPRGYRADRTTGTRRDVQIVSLDSSIDRFDSVTLLKTDTDGMEPKVLAGARKLIERDSPKLLFEVAPHSWAARKIPAEAMTAELEWLHGLGYRFQTEAGSPIEPAAAVHMVPYGETTNLVGLP